MSNSWMFNLRKSIGNAGIRNCKSKINMRQKKCEVCQTKTTPHGK